MVPQDLLEAIASEDSVQLMDALKGVLRKVSFGSVYASLTPGVQRGDVGSCILLKGEASQITNAAKTLHRELEQLVILYVYYRLC